VSSTKQDVTIVVDGVEIQAPEGAMLVDAAKHGDVEIPVFCYEPKLGGPVGACRMCLVEVEGIPKLQTSCSTPIRDGMVVYTQTDRVKVAQNAVVEFLLVNHPLDCPVCDKGGECPLQDIAMGWGAGKSRVTDPKRHFQKPVPLSPLVRIDRERCILCYRCVRFSQEVAEDEQLQLLERGSQTFVGTFDDRPYIAPFHGNVIELCPVGALTAEAYRFRARPWDIEDAGSICTLCPSQCNVKHTVRDDQVERVLARDNYDVDDGWLCDKGRFGFQMLSSEDRLSVPQIREAGALREASWEESLAKAAAGLAAAKGKVAALAGGSATNEEGYLVQRIVRGALGSSDVDSRPARSASRELRAALAAPAAAAKMADLDSAGAALLYDCDPLHEMPILDLRLRKAIRHTGLKLVVASARPTALDGGAEEVVRFAPGDAASFSLDSDAGQVLKDADSVVVIYGERVVSGPNADTGAQAVLDLASTLKLDGDGSGLLEVPTGANGRGLAEAGCLPSIGPGYSEAGGGRSADEIKDALESGDLEGLILWEIDPIRDLPDPAGWHRALGAAKFVVEVSMFGNASGGHADLVLPAQGEAEKEGTVTHPDGRLQRLRSSLPAPGAIRPGWQVLAELSARLGDETDIDAAPEALEALASEVPFYAGITHEEIGGQGLRWQDRDAAASMAGGVGGPSDGRGGTAGAQGQSGSSPADGSPAAPANLNGSELHLGTYRDLWAGEVAERNPALRFLAPHQTLELAPQDAERLGVDQGETVNVRSNGFSVKANVAIRERMRDGAGFLIDGIGADSANVLAGAQTVEVTKVGEER
jgi:NADH-quinone oxidoreductase subunit G